MGFSSIELFSRHHVLTADRRAKLQNEVSFALEHISKNISRAIGNERINGANSVVGVAPNVSIIAYIDANQDGSRQDPANNIDYYIAYRYDDNGPNAHQLRYCPRCANANCNFNQCTPGGGEVISSQITAFIPFKPVVNPGIDDTLSDNFVQIGVTACWDVLNTADCGSPDNPAVSMRTRISMPSVSTH